MKRRILEDVDVDYKYKKARQIIGTAASVPLGFITMNVPGVMIASKKVYDYLDPGMKDEVSQNILMSGSYQGKFALSANKAFKGLRDHYQKKGAVFIIENYGQVADPDLVYIGHSTWNDGGVVNAIGLALLKKLFMKAYEFDPQTTVEELPLIGYPQSGPASSLIVFDSRSSAGVRVTSEYVIPDDASLETILNNSGLYSIIFNQMTQSNPLVLEKLYVYTQQAGGPSHLACQIDLNKEVLKLAMSSHMIVQNRTKAAADGSLSTTQVDVQPLKGPVYEFSIGTPKLKAETPIKLNSMINTGIILARAAEFGGTDVTAYKEPPVKNAFQKCVKAGYVRLNSGALKSMTIGTDISGYYANVLFRLRVNESQGQTKNCFGKSQLVCLEEELNSGSSNLITVQYECQHIAGAEFITTSNPNMQPGYAQSQINNLPA